MIRAACVSESHNVVERAIILLIAVRVCSLLVRPVNDNSFALLAGYTRLLKDYNCLSYYRHKRAPIPVFDYMTRLNNIPRIFFPKSLKNGIIGVEQADILSSIVFRLATPVNNVIDRSNSHINYSSRPYYIL